MLLEFFRDGANNIDSSSAMCRRSNEAVLRGGFSLSGLCSGSILHIPFAICVVCAVAPLGKPAKEECI